MRTQCQALLGGNFLSTERQTRSLMNYLAVSVSVDSSLASPEEAINAVADFKSIVDATRTVMSGTYKKFAEKVIVRA